MRPQFNSGFYRGRTVGILTVGVDDPWLQAAIQSVGLPVLAVRHALPALQRIRVTRPLVVAIDRECRPEDHEAVARAAARVGAPVVEATFAGEARLTRDLRRAVEMAMRSGPTADALVPEEEIA